MCLFPLPNNNINSLAYLKGVEKFDCGSCPECLRKRSNVWALRAVYESKSHVYNCMITLTYDNFAYDDKGNVIGELPVNPNLKVCKRHIQLFIKRLRKWYSSISDDKIKYIACAEYGSRTHRAHYHCILFGVDFYDKHYYKKSKRGNIIYMSKILSSLWSHGICTIDSINVHSGIARYCTKYCAKSRSDDTFMLSSQHIGFNELIKSFNGLNYMIDGREYPIPRFVWEYYICNKYKDLPFKFSPKYVNRNNDLLDDFNYNVGCLLRGVYRSIRDNDELYVRYLDYWSKKGLLFDTVKLDARQRILQLNEGKYHFYKINALSVLDRRRKYFLPFIAPGSGCVSAYLRWADRMRITCRIPSCPNTASDTKNNYYFGTHVLRVTNEKSPNFFCQISLDI